jgi:hypothetical protein
MTDRDPDDAKLREAFARLRAADAKRLPAFDQVRRAPRIRPIRRIWMAAIPALAAAAAFMALCGVEKPVELASNPELPPPPSAPAEQALVSTKPALPLDFLLETSSGPLDSLAFLAKVPAVDSTLEKGQR